MEVSAELLERLSVPDAEQVRMRMSWQEFLALSDDFRAEWLDGDVVVSPPTSEAHAEASARLSAVLLDALPHLVVLVDPGVWLPGKRLRGPDLAVVRSRSRTTWVEQAPLLVVEVLSGSTRAEDTLRKPAEYAAAGVDQLWLVDPARRTIDVQLLVEGRWEPLLHLDDEQPTGEVALGEHGVVPLDLTYVLPG